MADDVIDSSCVSSLSPTAGKTIPLAGAAWAVGVPHRVGRRIGSLDLNLVGSGISHYLAGRRALAGFQLGMLLCLGKNPVAHAGPGRTARWMDFWSGAVH